MLKNPLHVNSLRSLSIASSIVVLISVLLILIISMQLYRDLAHAEKQWRSIESTAHSKLNLVSKLRHEIGFGGMIHDFKNFLLRGDESLLVQTRDHAAEAYRVLSAYRSLQNDEAELAALHHLTLMVQYYVKALDRVDRQRANGVSERDIDLQVRFDDGPAVQALSTLVRHAALLREQGLADLQSLHAKAIQSARLLIAGIVLIAVGVVLMNSLLMRFLTSHLRDAALTFSALARRETDIEIRYTDYQNEIGELARAATVFRYAMAKSLADANDELRRLLVTLSHELREPVRKSRIFLSLIKRGLGTEAGESAVRHADRLEVNLQTMEQQLDSVRAYMEVNASNLILRTVNLQVLCEFVIGELKPRIAEVQGQVRLVGHFPQVQADARHLQKLVTELLNNALKFHRENERPVVEISAKISADSKEVHVFVDDNGCGIAEQDADSLFQLLRRGASLNRGAEGEVSVGTGLAIARKIARAHGGDLTAAQSPRGGCRMELRLPLDG